MLCIINLAFKLSPQKLTLSGVQSRRKGSWENVSVICVIGKSEEEEENQIQNLEPEVFAGF